MREDIRKGLEGFLVVIISYLLVANVMHMIALREKHEFYISSDSAIVEGLRGNYQKFHENIEKLKTIKKTEHVAEADYKELLSSLETWDDAIVKTNVLSWNLSRPYTDVDVMRLVNKAGSLSPLNVMNSYDKIIKLDPDCGFDKDIVTSRLVQSIYSLGNVQNRLVNNYQYHEPANTVTLALGTDLITAYTSISSKILLMKDVSDYLVKDGGILES